MMADGAQAASTNGQNRMLIRNGVIKYTAENEKRLSMFDIRVRFNPIGNFNIL